MRIGVVIPTLNEAHELSATLDAVLAERPDDVIVVDGGSTDGTQDLAATRVRFLPSLPGRARQLNAGARELDTEILLFLHADCRLGAGSLDAIRRSLGDNRVAGGGFHKRFRSQHPLLRQGGQARTHLWHQFGYVLGDQAQFIRRACFERLGGFREDVLAEDMDLSWRMGLDGNCALLKPGLSLSARRLEGSGVLATWARWWSVVLRQGLQSAWDGPRRGSLSSAPRESRDSSGTG